MRLITSIALCLLLSLPSLAQDNNAVLENGIITGKEIKVNPNQKYYNPRIASSRSAIIPGWGQIYNDSWWKVPVLYTGFGVAIHFIGVNERNRNENLDFAAEELAKDIPNENLVRIYRRRADNWRKNRDLVILTMVGIYALQIIEAAVDAHLKGFNVDEDLALNIKPKLGVISNGAPYLGFGVTLPIGR
ncbi:hypothetical protein BFP97_08780 [Roseivirga sp. 4D4]|uniref:DUF5683 domain-containing protein n=1 Tax=Roseivirga sp. 4D4 TaxID=1889784 RepID=UPI000853D3DE|nr:DUF5683 domain-containing protein [Roseivirga sp. 4D4]OEK01606.1 hypothetical protein BFP97_08780 [Roseivirga sp. 4D4]